MLVSTLVVVAILVLVLLYGGISGVSLNASSGRSSSIHTVYFDETGLPAGTTWTVVVSGISQNSTTALISFAEPNGIYPYSVAQVHGYTAVPSSGRVAVNGSDVSVPISFSRENVPLGTVFGWGTPVNDTGTTTVGCPSSIGHYCYTIEIAAASGGVGTSNIVLSLREPNGDVYHWPTGITVSLFSPVNSSVLATYNVTTSAWSLVPPYSGNLSAGFTVVFYTATASGGLLGLMVVAAGINGFSGSVTSNPFS